MLVTTELENARLCAFIEQLLSKQLVTRHDIHPHISEKLLADQPNLVDLLYQFCRIHYLQHATATDAVLVRGMHSVSIF